MKQEVTAGGGREPEGGGEVKLSPTQHNPSPGIQCEGNGGAQLSSAQPNSNPRIQSVHLSKGSSVPGVGPQSCLPGQVLSAGPPGLVTMDSLGYLRHP